MNAPKKPARTHTPDGRVIRLVMPQAVIEAQQQRRGQAEPAPGQQTQTDTSGNVATAASPVATAKPVDNFGRPLAPPPLPPRKKGERVDWEAIKPLYCANHLSLRQIADYAGVSNPAIVQHARKHGWVRDQTDRIQAKADELVLEAEARNATLSEQLAEDQRSTDIIPGVPRSMTENAVVNAAANLIASVRLGQRERFSRMAQLSSSMFSALEEQFAHREGLSELGDLLETYDASGKPDALSRKYREAVELPGQIKAFKDLSDIIVKLTDMESRAFKLDKRPDADDSSRSSLPVRFVEPPMAERVDEDEDDGEPKP